MLSMQQLNIQNIETLHNSLVDLTMQLEKATSAHQIQNIQYAINATMRTIQQNDAVATQFYGHNREACRFWNQLHQAGFSPSLIPQLAAPQPVPLNQTFNFNPRVFISYTTSAPNQPVAPAPLVNDIARPKQVNNKVKTPIFDAKKCATELSLQEQNVLSKIYDAHIRNNIITDKDLAMHFDLTEGRIKDIKKSLHQKTLLSNRFSITSKGYTTAEAIASLREISWVTQRPLLTQRNIQNKRALETTANQTQEYTDYPPSKKYAFST